MNAFPQSHAVPALPALPLFDISVNRHGGNAQSAAANLRAHRTKRESIARVVALLEEAGREGLTCREACGPLMKQMHQVSGRFTEARVAGLAFLKMEGGERVVRDGCAVSVAAWYATDDERRAGR